LRGRARADVLAPLAGTETGHPLLPHLRIERRLRQSTSHDFWQVSRLEPS
jgi:hypothetical protein